MERGENTILDRVASRTVRRQIRKGIPRHTRHIENSQVRVSVGDRFLDTASIRTARHPSLRMEIPNNTRRISAQEEDILRDRECNRKAVRKVVSTNTRHILQIWWSLLGEVCNGDTDV